MFVRVLALGIVVASWFTSSPAHALSLGTSYGIGTRAVTHSAAPSPLALPSLDLRFDDVHLQFGILELINGFVEERANVLARGYFALSKTKATNDLRGIFAIGGGFNLFTRPHFRDTSVLFEALARFGVENMGEYLLGLYVTPGLGLAVMNGDLEMSFVGTLEASFALPL